VASGREPEWTSTGNAHSLILTPRVAILENEFIEPKLTYELPLEKFRNMLTHSTLQIVTEPSYISHL